MILSAVDKMTNHVIVIVIGGMMTRNSKQTK